MDGSLWLTAPSVHEIDPDSLIWPGQHDQRALQNYGIENLLVWVSNLGADDLHLQAGEPAKVGIHGRMFPVMTRHVTQVDIENIASWAYGPQVQPWLNAGNDFRRTKTVKIYTDARGRTEIGDFKPVSNVTEGRRNFRVHGNASKVNGANSCQLTVRVVKQRPPRPDELNLEPEITEAWKPEDGIVLVAGKPSTGKTSLLASSCLSYLEDPDFTGKVIELARPPEYNLYGLGHDRNMYTMSDIGRGCNYASITDAMEGCLSRAPEVVYAPEMIDQESMHVALQLGNSGIRTYATLHSTGAASTVERVLTVFPKNEREERAISLMHNLRLIISCKLVPSTDGKRIQLREYLPFTATTRAELLAIPYERWPAEIQFMTQSRGQTFAQAARRAAFEGKVTPDVLNRIQVER